MEHEHLKFYSNGARNGNAAANGSSAAAAPSSSALNAASIAASSSSSLWGVGPDLGGLDDDPINKPMQEKYINIIEYLKALPRDQRATFIDIERSLHIDIKHDTLMLDMLKSNPKVDIEYLDPADPTALSFQFRAKYEFQNKHELVRGIDRVKCGILMSDVQDCYPNAASDINLMILGGEVIACKNSEKKSMVLFPRGQAFLTKLTGDVTAKPSSNLVETSHNVQNEIRRGDAVRVGDSWFRVSSAIRNGSSVERSKMPPSVTSDKAWPDRLVFFDEFNATTLPLDGDYDGTEEYKAGVAVRHGCSNDVRSQWLETAGQFRQNIADEHALLSELVKQNLVTRSGSVSVAQRRKPTTTISGQIKKQRKQRVSTVTSHHNAHLKGTQLERIVSDVQAALRKEDQA
jgi:hypothetical protein